MKPKDLKSPFTWEERRVVLQDKVWHVPDRCSDYGAFSFPGWDHASVFGNANPVIIEYCCGNGSWIAAKAQQHPEFNWVGVEMRFERVRKVWSKIQNFGLNNLLVVCGEALLTTRLYVPSHTIRDVYVNFPDPWPKKRHAKNRLLQGSFIQELARILRPEGAVTIVTDDPDYSGQVISEFQAVPEFLSAFSDPFFATEWPAYGSSYFDSLWRGKGRLIRYHRFVKDIQAVA